VVGHRRRLHDGLATQLEATPDIRVPDIQVMIVLGDPADDHFMNVNLGMAASGGASGYLWFNFWPSVENLSAWSPWQCTS